MYGSTISTSRNASMVYIDSMLEMRVQLHSVISLLIFGYLEFFGIYFFVSTVHGHNICISLLYE